MYWNWFKSNSSRASQMADRAFVKMTESRRQLRRDLKELQRIEKKTSALLERLSMVSETLKEDVEECERRLSYSEKALEALRSEHEVDAEVTIPILTKRLREMEARSEAEIAVSNHRRAGATPINFDRE